MKALPPYSSLEKYWNHDTNTVFLNHGSFGSCPEVILKRQNKLREETEQDPVRAMTTDFESHYLENKEALAAFVGCKPTDIVFIRNTTEGVNTILHSLQLKEGDEILTHSHIYGACLEVLKYYAERYRCKLTIAEIPFPINRQGDITDAILRAVSPSTKIALIDHISSSTGIIFPVGEITQALESRGIEVLVDGAHAPGMVALNIPSIGASYYTGNCHKWICSPRGSALLYVREDKQDKIKPLQLSHYHDLYEGSNKHWSAQFIWPGTDDYSSYLMIKDSLQFMEGLFGSWEKLREHNRNLCLSARKLIADSIGVSLPAPEDMISHLSSIPVNEKPGIPEKYFNLTVPLKQKLMDSYRIQVPVFYFNKNSPGLYLRISVQAYNCYEQYEYLAESLREIKSKG